MAQCSPHAWRTPTVGDAALVCDICESRLDLARDLTPEAQANLLRDYRRHFGPIVSGNFEEALAAAVTAARQRAGGERAVENEVSEEGST